MILSETQARRLSSGYQSVTDQRCELRFFGIGVGDGNRTRNRRSHSPMLYQVELLPPQISIIAITKENGFRLSLWALASEIEPRCG